MTTAKGAMSIQSLLLTVANSQQTTRGWKHPTLVCANGKKAKRRQRKKGNKS